MDRIQDLFQALWLDYANQNPIAGQIHSLLESRGERVVNDHVAFRTFNLPNLNIHKVAKSFVQAGYVEKGLYEFKEKKLIAKHFEYPDGTLPKVFISELLLEEFPDDFQMIVKQLGRQVPTSKVEDPLFPVSGILWTPIDYATYEFLRTYSEYAAWLAINGFRANHFTVSVNELKTFQSLSQLNQFLKDNGFKLNAEGGEIKGSAAEYLEQSSTLSNIIQYELADGSFALPGCYYEFALRYPDSNGQLYQGFIAKSADKIFESTDKKAHR